MASGGSALLRVQPLEVRTGNRLAPADQRARRRAAPDGVAARIRCGSPRGGDGRTGVMKVALVNPNWTFDGSIYFGCREPHLPLEFGYSKALLQAAGHEAYIVDGQLHG